ncbi:type VI secretion system-associated protein TagF [Cellvibrio sp. OA-2007]|uniref:type VI secretion system-associated protein TagF n=1 Tax=Cellvibrio sp. OA-2007 TaxID=529823 RepID=UPI000782C3F7|nr:type VI secretion system-associated protein TagF [Cellvibrio sp. OA-2007]
MSDASSPFNCGFYGKIPSSGDFVSRDMPYSYVQYFDNWFSAGMVGLFSDHQDWLNSYLTAPVWSFVICPGVWGEEYLYGAVMPSVDSVGRYFPFVAILRGETLSCVDSVSYLPSLANELPILLQESFLLDSICAFLVEHVGSEVPASIVLAALNTLESSQGESCWWCAEPDSSEHPFHIHRGPPDVELFKKLFSNA